MSDTMQQSKAIIIGSTIIGACVLAHLGYMIYRDRPVAEAAVVRKQQTKTSAHKLTYDEWINAVRSSDQIAADLGVDKETWKRCRGGVPPLEELARCGHIVDRVTAIFEEEGANRAAKYGADPPPR